MSKGAKIAWLNGTQSSTAKRQIILLQVSEDRLAAQGQVLGAILQSGSRAVN
jgi:hypothetical protein